MSLALAHIACCVDRSEASGLAVAEALRMRRLAPGRLTLVHVAPPAAVLTGGLTEWEIEEEDPLGPPRRWLEEYARTLDGAEPVLLSGDPPARVVSEWMAGAGVDLVVAAAFRDRVQRTLLGSFARQLAYEAPRNVLIARPGREDDDGGAWRHVGCCIDESEGSARAAALTREIAALAPVQVTMVHVVAPPQPLPRRLIARLLPAPGGRRRRAQDLLDGADAIPGAERVVLTGPPGPATCSWAESASADLLVVGPRAGGRPGLGGFASSVVAAAPCAVLLARPGS